MNTQDMQSVVEVTRQNGNVVPQVLPAGDASASPPEESPVRTVFIPLVVEVSKVDGQLVAHFQPVPTVLVGAGRTELQWILATQNPFSDAQATFGLPDGRPGIEARPPQGVNCTHVTQSPVEWSVEVDNSRTTPPNIPVPYIVNGTFDGRGFSLDPVIVVTPEPIHI